MSLSHTWRAARTRASRNLGWKLALSHLKVTLIAQLINIIGVGLIMVSVGQVRAPFSGRELAETTRILATTLALPMAGQSGAELSAMLARLPAQRAGADDSFPGVLLPSTALVVLSPDGVVLASSTPDVPVGAPRAKLQPSVWGQALGAALAGERDGDAPALNGRDRAMSVLVSAYPITDAQGRVLGALGVRSAPVPLGGPQNQGQMLVSLTVVFGMLFLLVSLIASGVAAAIGALLARSFGRRLGALADATEAIARGDLSARVVVTDQDEIGQIATRFNLLTERLDAIDRARRSFVANISHELRTPLAIIRGHLETQLASPTATLPREALEVIDREARALGTLIDDLFTLTRIEEGSLPMQTRPVAVPELAAAAVSGIRALASRQGHVAVHSVVPGDLPLALADPTRLVQILNNLLYNALRHTPDGGVIVIEGAPTADGAAIELAVSDTGVGIAPADLPFIFERFFQGQHGGGSSGIGLAIVKQLVEAQGGTVCAESAPGQGTTIRLRLPRAG